MIRTLVDFIPVSEPLGPMMVLEAFTDSIWEVRNARPFTTKEIKWIMKGVLLCIFTVHMKGPVYTGRREALKSCPSMSFGLGVLILTPDLKMENVILGGFDH